mgnify:FL=1
MNEQAVSQSNNFAQKIEAVLFWKAEPVSLKKLASLIGATEEETTAGLDGLRKSLVGRGIAVIENKSGDTHEVTLGTSPEHSEMIKALTKDELMRDLGKAGLETLSIILYQGPVSRAEIDYIRGVNSQFILRNLLIRGLIERRDNPKDQRSYLYAPTIELISHLGVTRIEDLPDYEAVRRDIESFKVQHTDGPIQNEVAQN